MGTCPGQHNLFGNVNPKSIRFYQNSLVANEGADQIQKMLLNQMVAPYEQILRGRITLEPGKCKYLLNHLGLGDNATFLAILAEYNSNIEAKNFVQYAYYSDPNVWMSFSQMLLLTGNSENRIPQLYLTNPNKSEKVTLDVLVGVIDSDSGFFSKICDQDKINAESIIKYCNLQACDVILWEQGVIAILNPGGVPQCFIHIEDINSVEKVQRIITINDRSIGTIILEFIDEENAIQALSFLSMLIENPDIIEHDCEFDTEAPVIYFTENVSLDNSDTSPVFNSPIILSTLDGNDFIAEDYPLLDEITKNDLIIFLIDHVEDNRDGIIELSDENIVITDNDGEFYNIIELEGDYVIKFDITDIAGNSVSEDVNIKITVI